MLKIKSLQKVMADKPKMGLNPKVKKYTRDNEKKWPQILNGE